MIVDAASVGACSIDGDVCVIGSGPAGATIATELAGHGLDVIVVEAGGGGSFAPGGVLETGETCGVPYPLGESRTAHVGGSANLWHVWNPNGAPVARFGPVRPEHFEPRPWLGEPGWPFDQAHLVRWFARAGAVLGLGGLGFSVPTAMAERARSLAEGFDLGVLRFGELTAITQIQRSLLHTGPARVLVRAPVTELVPNPAGTALSHVVVSGPAGSQLTVAASMFVLAAGGIDNARSLLLLAGPANRGPGNRNDLVGRYFMEHPHRRSAVIRTRSTLLEEFDQTRRDVAGTSGEVWFFTDPDEARRRGVPSIAVGVNAASPGVFARGRWMDRPAEVDGPFGDLWRRALRTAEQPRRRDVLAAAARDPLVAAQHFGRRVVGEADARRLARWGSPGEHLYSIQMMAEHVPHAENRVTLSRRRDPLGVPVAKLTFTLHDETLRGIRRNHELFVEQLRRSIDGEIISRAPAYRSPAGFSWGYHHMGTTRMHDDPTLGVVDADSRVHDLDNLYVAGSSVFPTSGTTNPTFTLVALALRLADHLAERLGTAARPAPDRPEVTSTLEHGGS